jgi:hypothetical protein
MSNIREVPMPEAGEGAHLLFRNLDLMTLQNKLGPNWFVDAVPKLDRYDMEYIEACLAAGGVMKDVRDGIKLSQLEKITMAELAKRICDALFLAVHGKTFEGFMKAMAQMADDERKRLEEEQRKNEPSPASS